MANGLSGKSAIVTGAAHGVGLAVARRLVRAGASVMMADTQEAKLHAEVEALEDAGYDGRASAFVGDLREKLAMTNLMAATLDAQDGVDILVNGCRMLAASDPLDPEADRFEQTMAQNVTANLRLSQIVARRMIEAAAAAADAADGAADRAILNISSVHGQRANPSLLAYSVSCAAVEHLTRALAITLARHGVRVNALAVGGVPGRALTEALSGFDDLADRMRAAVPLGRLGEAQEAAEAALYLVSPQASFVTGHVMVVDGGRLLDDALNPPAS